MIGIRRHGQLLGIAFAWLLALAALLNGLSLARALPEAHAGALSAASLCLTADGGAPRQHQAHHAAGCVVCPGPSLADPPTGLSANTDASTIHTRLAAAAEFDDRSPVPRRNAEKSFAQARGPPQA